MNDSSPRRPRVAGDVPAGSGPSSPAQDPRGFHAGPKLRLGLGALGLAWLLTLTTLTGCPPKPVGGDREPPAPANGVGAGDPSGVAPVPSGAVNGPALPSSWSEQAARCIALLEQVAAKAEAGDRDGALALEDKAYHEEYENVGHDLEVACRTYLPEEMFEGKMRNVVIAREDSFAQIRGAVKAGAPGAKVRSLVGDLSAKIRADATKLDAMPNAKPR